MVIPGGNMFMNKIKTIQKKRSDFSYGIQKIVSSEKQSNNKIEHRSESWEEYFKRLKNGT